jgi:hypothetical protein
MSRNRAERRYILKKIYLVGRPRQTLNWDTPDEALRNENPMDLAAMLAATYATR